jgi:hypothetical protein
MLVPGIVMLIVHRHLGLSDALNVATPPGEREAHLFNWGMVLFVYLGAGVFLLHALSLWSRGRGWVFAKLAFLAFYWALVMVLA